MKARLRRALHRLFVPKQVRNATHGDTTHRGEGLAHGLELVIPTVLFTLLGLWLDDALGTKPLFLVVGFVFGAAGTFASQYYKYRARSEALDAGQPSARGTVANSGQDRP